MFVILNELKNLCRWLSLCYDAILHFVQNDMGKGKNDMGKGKNDKKVTAQDVIIFYSDNPLITFILSFLWMIFPSSVMPSITTV